MNNTDRQSEIDLARQVTEAYNRVREDVEAMIGETREIYLSEPGLSPWEAWRKMARRHYFEERAELDEQCRKDGKEYAALWEKSARALLRARYKYRLRTGFRALGPGGLRAQ